MFTGIVEALGKVRSVKKDKGNLIVQIQAPFAAELKAGDSVAHNGVCLTVTQITTDDYEVVLVDETLQKTNFREIVPGNLINLERSLVANGRVDGHFVQGHVDTVLECTEVIQKEGSTVYRFGYPDTYAGLLVDKGSVCVNGVSLTIASLDSKSFSVEIIPFTAHHTNFSQLKKGDKVNVEFDLLGKYILRQRKIV